MSNSSRTFPGESPSRSTLGELVEPLRESALQAVVAPLRFVGFWMAVSLPFLYVPLLMGGLTGQQALVFVGLLLVNVVALVVGHDYEP